MKKVQVVWTQESVADLDVIYDFIAQESPESANKIVQAILSRTRQLENFPESGSVENTTIKTDRAYRYLVEGHYKIVYSHNKDGLYVEAIIDTRQNPHKLRL